MTTTDKRNETMKATTLEAVRNHPGVKVWGLGISRRHYRFLRILEQEGRIEWRTDNEGLNEGWYECQPSDPYETDSIHGRSKNL